LTQIAGVSPITKCWVNVVIVTTLMDFTFLRKKNRIIHYTTKGQ